MMGENKILFSQFANEISKFIDLKTNDAIKISAQFNDFYFPENKGVCLSGLIYFWEHQSSKVIKKPERLAKVNP